MEGTHIKVGVNTERHKLHPHYGEIVCAEETEDVNHDEETAVAVQAMIKQFAEWGRSSRAPRLFAVDAVQRVSDQNIHTRHEEDPARDLILLDVVRGGKVKVVVSDQDAVENGQHKAGECEKIRCDPHGEEL